MSIEAMKRWLDALEYHTQQTRPIAKTNEAIVELRQAIEQAQKQDRHALQAKGEHPAPCARFCEANAFQIEIRSLKARIEQAQKQEPVAWLNRDSVDGLWYPNAFKTDNLEPSMPLYAAPPQRQWVGLTDEEIKASCELHTNWFAISKDLEAKLKEKNT